MNLQFGPLWTPDEDATLRALARRVHRDEIAAIVGRSVLGVQARANRLGIPLDIRKWDRPKRNPDISTWTEADRLAAWADVPQRLAEMVVSACHNRNLEVKLVRSAARNKKLVECRWYIARRAKSLGYSYPLIGRALNRDHSTIIHAVRKSSPKTNKTGDSFTVCSSEHDRIAA